MGRYKKLCGRNCTVYNKGYMIRMQQGTSIVISIYISIYTIDMVPMYRINNVQCLYTVQCRLSKRLILYILRNFDKSRELNTMRCCNLISKDRVVENQFII